MQKRRRPFDKLRDHPSRASASIVTLNLIQHDGSLLGKHFFLTQKNPFPELVEGNLFAKEHRHFDRLSDRVAAQVVCLAKMCRSLRLSKGAVCKEMPAFRLRSVTALVVHECILLMVPPPPIRHPELVSGSVEVLAECFTDPESSSG